MFSFCLQHHVQLPWTSEVTSEHLNYSGGMPYQKGVGLIGVGAEHKCTHRTGGSVCVTFFLLVTNSPTHPLKGLQTDGKFSELQDEENITRLQPAALLSPASFARARARANQVSWWRVVTRTTRNVMSRTSWVPFWPLPSSDSKQIKF